jgi:ATP-dependent helicase/nuclease subunit B
VPLAAETRANASRGRHALRRGGPDRPDGRRRLAIVDYKTGTPRGRRRWPRAIRCSSALLGLIAENGGFEGVDGIPACFEYWSLARSTFGTLGYVKSPVGGRSGIDPADFTDIAERNFIAAAEAWLTGSAPFTAKLHPEHAPYGEYDQLMRSTNGTGARRRRRPRAEPSDARRLGLGGGRCRTPGRRPRGTARPARRPVEHLDASSVITREQAG